MPPSNKPTRVDVWHNLLWSRYKGEVFSELHKINNRKEFLINFIQIAETDDERTSLTAVNEHHHRYPYTLLFTGSYNDISLFRRVARIIRTSWNSDAEMIILAGYAKIDYWLQLALLMLKQKQVLVWCDSTIHDNPQTWFRGVLKTIFFRSVEALFCYGTRSKEYVVHYGANPARAIQPCHAAALPPDYSSAGAFADRLALAPSPTRPRYLYVGRLAPEKGLNTLLNAFARVRRQQPHATLTLVGSGTAYDALVAQTLQLGLHDAVIFSGSKSGFDLVRDYLTSTCLILPSTSEPWGLVVNEALSYGCPAIVSQICGCVPDLIVEGQTGTSHITGDADDLAQKMIAAPSQFADTRITARHCLDLIGHYTPEAAARQILGGLRLVRSRS